MQWNNIPSLPYLSKISYEPPQKQAMSQLQEFFAYYFIIAQIPEAGTTEPGQ
jgi:hypothetical protein